MPSSREGTPHLNNMASSSSRPPPGGALSTSSSSHALFSSIGSYGGPLAESTTTGQPQQLTSPTGHQLSSGSFNTGGTFNSAGDMAFPSTGHHTQANNPPPPLPRGRNNPTVSFPAQPQPPLHISDSHPFHAGDGIGLHGGHDVHNTSSTAHMSSRTRSFSRNNSNHSTPLASPIRERPQNEFPQQYTQIISVLPSTPSAMATAPPQHHQSHQHPMLNDGGGMARLASSSLSDINSFGATGPTSTGGAATVGSGSGVTGARYTSSSSSGGGGRAHSGYTGSSGYTANAADISQNPQYYPSSTDHSPRGGAMSGGMGESMGQSHNNSQYGRVLSPFSGRGGSTATDDSSRHQSESRNASVHRQPLSANTSPRLVPVGRTTSTAPQQQQRSQHLFSTSSSSVASSKTASYVPHANKTNINHVDPAPTVLVAPEVRGGDDGGRESSHWSRSISSHPGISVNPSLPRSTLPRSGGSIVRSPVITSHSQCNSPGSSSNNSGAALFSQPHRSIAPLSTSSRGGGDEMYSRSPSLQASTSFHPPVTRVAPSMSQSTTTLPPQRGHPTQFSAASAPNPSYLNNHRNSLTTSIGQQPLNSPTISSTATFQRHMQRQRFVTTVSDDVLSQVAPIAREWHPTPAFSSLSAHQRLYLSSIELTAFTAVEKEILQLQDAYHAIYRAENVTERRRRSGKKHNKQKRRASACSAGALSADWSKSPATSPKNGSGGISHISHKLASPHGMRALGGGGGGFFPPTSDHQQSAISSPVGQGGLASPHYPSMGIANEKATKLVDIYIRTVLRLASMPIAFLSPQMGVVEYDVLVRRLRRAGYISYEMDRGTTSPEASGGNPISSKQQQPISILFAGHLKATLTAPSAIAIHKNTDAIIKKRTTMSPYQHAQRSSTDLPQQQPTITSPTGLDPGGQAFPPPTASLMPTTSSTTRSSSPNNNYAGGGMDSVGGGGRAPGAVAVSPSMQTSTPRSIGGVSLMGKTHSNASQNLHLGGRRQSLPGGQGGSAGFNHPPELPRRTAGSLSSIPSNATGVTIGSSSGGGVGSSGDHNTYTYTYEVHMGAPRNALETEMQVGSAPYYPPDHTSPSHRTRGSSGGGGGGGNRPGASDSAVFGGASTGALYDNPQGIEDTLAVSRRAADVKWTWTPARPGNREQSSPNMRPANNSIEGDVEEDRMPPMPDYTYDPMGTITSSIEVDGDGEVGAHPRSKSDIGLGVPIRSLDASETQHPDSVNTAGSGGPLAASGCGGNAYPGTSTLTFGSGFHSSVASNHPSQNPVMMPVDEGPNKVISLGRPFAMAPESMTDSMGRSVPVEILPPQHGSSLNTPPDDDEEQQYQHHQQHQQQQHQEHHHPHPTNINNNARAANSSSCFNSYHGGYSAPSGIPSYLSAANQFGNLNSSLEEQGDDDMLRGMYGQFDSDDEGHGEES